jgi:hypothetical protein
VADVLQAASPPAASLRKGQHSPVAVAQASTRSARATTTQDCGREIIMASVMAVAWGSAVLVLKLGLQLCMSV